MYSNSSPVVSINIWIIRRWRECRRCGNQIVEGRRVVIMVMMRRRITANEIRRRGRGRGRCRPRRQGTAVKNTFGLASCMASSMLDTILRPVQRLLQPLMKWEVCFCCCCCSCCCCCCLSCCCCCSCCLFPPVDKALGVGRPWK